MYLLHNFFLSRRIFAEFFFTFSKEFFLPRRWTFLGIFHTPPGVDIKSKSKNIFLCEHSNFLFPPLGFLFKILVGKFFNFPLLNIFLFFHFYLQLVFFYFNSLYFNPSRIYEIKFSPFICTSWHDGVQIETERLCSHDWNISDKICDCALWIVLVLTQYIHYIWRAWYACTFENEKRTFGCLRENM